MKKHLSVIITLAALAVFAWYAATHRSMFTALGKVDWWLLALIALCRLTIIFSNGWFTKWTVEAFVAKMPAAEGFLLSVLTAVGNFFGPLIGGLGFRAYYLKKYHNFPLTKFTSTLIGYYLIMYIFNSLMAVVALLLAAKTHQSVYVLAFFAVWLVASLCLAFVKLPARKKLDKLASNKIFKQIIKIFYEVEGGWRVILDNKKLLAKMSALSATNVLATLAMSILEFYALGLSASLAGIALYTSLVEVSMFVAVTPDSLGVREVILVLLAVTIGISHGQVLQLAVIDRGVQFILLGLLFASIRHSKIRHLLQTARPATG